MKAGEPTPGPNAGPNAGLNPGSQPAAPSRPPRQAAPGTLHLVATPIGNLADITLRALDILRSADIVAAEDTRHSRILLDHHGIRRPLLSCHEHNEAARADELVAALRNGSSVALLTDAGTPGISDPGARLVRKCVAAGLPCTVIPGPSAPIAALAGSGLDTARFFFGGFLPNTSGRRERALSEAFQRPETSIFFESPHRLCRTLDLCARIAPDRPLCVARELTKHFEEFRRGTAAQLREHFHAHPPKGEITLVIAGSDA